MKISITGGAGYVGSALAQQLAKTIPNGFITLIDNLLIENFSVFTTLHAPSGKVTFKHADILDSHAMKKMLEGTEVLIHAAGIFPSITNSYSSHQLEQINHWGTAEVANVAEVLGIKKIVFLSDVQVFDGLSGMVPPDATPLCRSAYSWSKYRAEKQLQRLPADYDVFILRCAEIYGPAPVPAFSTPLNYMLWKAHFNRRIQIEGNGRQVYPYVFLPNLVIFIQEIVQGNITNPGVYTLSDISLSTLDILDALQELLPNLEFIFINPHYQPNSLEIAPDPRFAPTYTDWKQNLATMLATFRF